MRTQIVSPFPGVPMLRGEAGLDDWLAQRGGGQRLAGVVAVGGSRGRERLALMALLQVRGLAPVRNPARLHR